MEKTELFFYKIRKRNMHQFLGPDGVRLSENNFLFFLHSDCHLYYHFATIHPSKSSNNKINLIISQVFELFAKHYK